MNLLGRIAPTPVEVAAMAKRVARLLNEMQAALDNQGVVGEATMQGSLAKGTWLQGASDADVFLLLEPDTPTAALESIARKVGEAVLDNVQAKYAQHPYVEGMFENLRVDVVPAFRVSAAHDKMSAVDRTPFHTAWVKETFSDRMLDDVRLFKQWLKGVGAYGAETALGGFSGYLVEVIIARKRNFEESLRWLAGGADPRKWDDVPEAALQIADPVDAGRNVAAAVREDTLARAIEAAKAYLAAPSEDFFFPPAPDVASAAALQTALQPDTWLGVRVHSSADRLDIVFPQFQRVARTLVQAMENAGFAVRRHSVEAEPPILMQFVVDAAVKPAEEWRTGPPPSATANANRFRDKWQGHPDALGPVQVVDGKLAVKIRASIRTAADALTAALAQPLGKHMDAATASVLLDPAEASPWSLAVSDFILDRRPWQ